VYDGQQIALQFDRTSALGHRYLSGPAVDQVLADENASGVVRWLLADHEGTIRDVAQYDSGTDQTTVVDHLKYDAFGTITSESNSSAEPHFAYTGRDWDPDVGLYYNRARWYDPKTGRFLSEDPSRFKAKDTNLNRYVWNRPTSVTDPTGGSGGEDPNSPPHVTVGGQDVVGMDSFDRFRTQVSQNSPSQVTFTVSQNEWIRPKWQESGSPYSRPYLVEYGSGGEGDTEHGPFTIEVHEGEYQDYQRTSARRTYADTLVVTGDYKMTAGDILLSMESQLPVVGWEITGFEIATNAFTRAGVTFKETTTRSDWAAVQEHTTSQISDKLIGSYTYDVLPPPWPGYPCYPCPLTTDPGPPPWPAPPPYPADPCPSWPNAKVPQPPSRPPQRG
jgi:RHS repeat-associated protein